MALRVPVLDISWFHTFKYNFIFETSISNIDENNETKMLKEVLENLENERSHAFRLGDSCRDGVVHVDHREESCEEETKSARDCFKADSKTDPAGDNPHERGEDKI